MQYDFTTVLDRQGMDALAVDHPPAKPKEGFDVIPMWVADMNFPAVPTIPEAIMARTSHTTYGYFLPRQAYYDAIIRWQLEQNGVQGLENRGRYHRRRRVCLYSCGQRGDEGLRGS